MKAFERIFLYSVLAILVFYVFLVDGNVESKEVIQEEISYKKKGLLGVKKKIVLKLDDAIYNPIYNTFRKETANDWWRN